MSAGGIGCIIIDFDKPTNSSAATLAPKASKDQKQQAIGVRIPVVAVDAAAGGALRKRLPHTRISLLLSFDRQPVAGRTFSTDSFSAAAGPTSSSTPAAVAVSSSRPGRRLMPPRNSKSGHQLIQNTQAGILSLRPGGRILIAACRAARV